MRARAFIPLLFAPFVIPGIAQAQTKIAYVNSQEIMAAAPGAKEARDEFNKEMEGYQKQVQQLQDTLQTMQDQLQRQELTLSPEAKKNREAEIQAKEHEYQQRYQALQNQANTRKQQLMQPIVTKVDSIIDEVRKRGHYAMILDLAGGSILAADTTLDLTREVIRSMNAGAGGDSAKAGVGTGKGTGGSGGTR